MRPYTDLFQTHPEIEEGKSMMLYCRHCTTPITESVGVSTPAGAIFCDDKCHSRWLRGWIFTINNTQVAGRREHWSWEQIEAMGWNTADNPRSPANEMYSKFELLRLDDEPHQVLDEGTETA